MTTNDPAMEQFQLSLRADIEVAVYVMPRYVNLYTDKQTQTTRQVEIRAGLEKPLTLEPIRFDLEGTVIYEIQEIEKGKVFRLLFTNTLLTDGHSQGVLLLKTNYPEKPELVIPVRVRITGSRPQALPGPGKGS